MASKMFKTKLGKEGLKKGATYKPGELGYNPELVDDIIGEFLSMKRSDPYIVTDGERDFFEECVEKFAKKLRPEIDEEFEHQSFLDALVGKLTVREPEDFHLGRMDSLFSPLIQALYGLERNGFSLDVFHLPHSPYRMASYLSGTEDNLLRLSYNCNVFRFGEYPSYCRLETFGEVQHMAGSMARDSELIFHIPPKVMGLSAENTRFFLPGVDKVTMSKIIGHEYPPRIQFLLKSGDSETKTTVESTFFTKGNNIYIPDCPGKWKKVPE